MRHEHIIRESSMGCEDLQQHSSAAGHNIGNQKMPAEQMPVGTSFES